jgi:hypothetical protein
VPDRLTARSGQTVRDGAPRSQGARACQFQLRPLPNAASSLHSAHRLI